MTNYISDTSYLALKVETTDGTAVKPDTFVPFVSESVKTNLNITADRRFKGNNWKSDDVLKGIRTHEGDIVVMGDVETLAHMFNMLYLKDTTTGDATGYTHPFEPGSPKSYTIEFSKGNYAQRYFGVKADQLKIEFVDGKCQASLSIKAKGQFSIGTLKTALAGASTAIVLEHTYDQRPTDGLAIGDVLSVLDNTGAWKDVTITGITDTETVAFGSTSITADAGNTVILKPQTPSYTTIKEPLYLGCTLVGVGVDTTAADTAAATRATATPFYEFSLVLKNNLLDAPTFGSQDPLKLLPQTLEGELTVSQLFEDQEQRLNWLNMVKQALTLISTGSLIAGGTNYEKLTIKLHKIKTITNDEPLEVGQYIFDKQVFEVLYDASDAKSIEVDIINAKAGTVY